MASDQKGDFILKTLGREIVKVKRVYDGLNRVIEQYEAPANAVHGSPCLKTEYTYVGSTEFVDKMKESVGAWDSSYDI